MQQDGLGSTEAQLPPAHTQLARHLRHVPNIKSLDVWKVPDYITGRTDTALRITTRHYLIHTTVQDPLILRQIPMLLESAFQSYSETIGMEPQLEDKLIFYLFRSRAQWEDFTRQWAGREAPLYLQISSGAYYLKGVCVAYHINRQANFSVLAHEGWHQFRDQVFTYHLPAWVDEGLATNFEAYQWQQGQVKFIPRLNGGRLMAVRQALINRTTFRLSELLASEPGGVISHNSGTAHEGQNPKMEAYYGQIYALTRFLREYEYGRYLQSFTTMLSDGYSGEWPLPDELRAEAAQREHNPTRRWNAAIGPGLFQTYIHADIAEIEQEYLAFCKKIIARVAPR